MRYVISVLLLLACVVGFSALSWLGIYGFWIGVWLFQSVPVARACDTIGKVLLLPARGFLWITTGLDNPVTPLFEPMWYVVINGVLLGLVSYILLHRILLRRA